MVTAVFDKSTKYVTAERLWQWDYGQILRIQGLQLPQAVEIHFSKTENSGDSVTRIGVTKDEVTEVLIPDSMLESTGDIYAFVYLRTEHTGETEYKVMIPLKERPRPEIPGTSEEGGIFEEVVQAVRESADQAAESARQAGLIKDSVQDMVDTIGSIDEQVQAVKEFAQKAETASSNAALSESKAKESETAAETAKTSAVQSAESARQSATAVEKVGQEVSEHKTAVEQAVGGFDKKVSEASTAIESAKTGAVKAVEDKGNEVLQSIPQDFETQMAGKLDKHQGTENAGKALVVGEDGNVVPGEVASGGGDGIAIINTMSGASPLVIPDSAERANKGFRLTGNTEQASTTGAQLFDEKNLLDFDSPNYDKTAIGTGVIRYKFQVSETVTVSVSKINKDGEYLCVGIEPDGSDSFWLSHKSAASTNLKTLTPKDGNIYLGVSNNIDNVKNMLKKVGGIMINYGSVAITYEPYTGGKPSPSPEYPQEIKNVGKWNEEKQKYEVDVKVTGKNLFDIEKAKILSNWIPSAAYNGYSNFPVFVGKNKKVTISYTEELKSDYGFYLGVNLKKENRIDKWLYGNDGSLSNNKVIITSTEDYIYICCNTSSITGFLNKFVTFQIEYGDTATVYQSYAEQTITLTSDRPITKWDKLVEQDGQIGWLYGTDMSYQNITESAIEANDITESFGRYYVNAIKGKRYSELVCNISPYTKYMEDGACGFWWSDTLCMKVSSTYTGNNGTEDIATAINNFKKNILSKGITVYFQKEIAEFVPLPQSEQDAIRALTTYYPTTVITADGGEVIPSVELTYTADTKNYILNREKITQTQIANIQAALISQKISGGGIKVTDSSNLPVREFTMSGKTKQVSTEGKNLIDIPKIVLGPDWRIDGDKLYCDKPSLAYRTSEIMIPLKEVTTYYFSALIKTDNNSIHVSVDLLDANKEPLVKNVIIFENGNREKSFTTKPEHAYCKVYFRNRTINEGGSIESIMLSTVKGIAYEPYTGGKPSPSPDFPQPIEVTPQGIITVDFTDGTNHQTVELNCPREFTKWDKLEKIDGVWCWVFKNKKVKSTEMKVGGLHHSGAIMIGNEFGIKENVRAFCDKLIYTDSSIPEVKNGEFRIAFGNIYIRTNEVTSNEDVSQWISENEFLIIAESTDAEITPLSQSEQDKLNALTMYSPNTEITNTGGCNMELTYTVDTKSYVDTKIAEISTAIVQKGI